MNYIVYNAIIECVEEMGDIVFEKGEADFNIGNYITDSIIFIEYIIKLESRFEIELPEDFLTYDILYSAKVFSEKLTCYLISEGKVVASGE